MKEIKHQIDIQFCLTIPDIIIAIFSMIEKKSTPVKEFSIKTATIIALFSVYVLGGITLVILVNTRMKSQALVEAEKKARILADINLSVHSYFAEALRPKVFPLSDKLKGRAYFEPSWMSSTYAVREIVKNFAGLNDTNYYYKESAINARSPDNEADIYESNFIKELNINKDIP